MNHRFCHSMPKLHRIEYLVIDRNFIILETSARFFDFAEASAAIATGQDVRLGFPELVGYEPQLDAMFEPQKFEPQKFEPQNDLTLRGIARSTAENHLLYIDLHVERDDNDSADQLLISIEDVSKRMILEQHACSASERNRTATAKLTEQMPPWKSKICRR
ncbi:MAG: hypothetical protein HC895_15680 [Leptolyngbyaceae cyanobacterium SM1_3_5]|nr:hypothetical protein [Leptolyngbyaceae cyanobacterium SM1_3_5]